MQKNKIILMLTIGMILSPILTIQAVTTTTKIDPAKIEEFKAQLKKEAESVKSTIGTDKTLIESKLNSQEKKVVLAKKSKDKINDLVEKIYNKFNTQIGKLYKVDEKMAAKVSGLEKDGADVSKIKAQYAVAKNMLTKTNSEILATRAIINEQVSKEIAKSTIRTLVKSGEESIKKVGEEYRKLLPMMAPENGNETSRNNN